MCSLGCECHDYRNSIWGCSLPHPWRPTLILLYSSCQVNVCCRAKVSVELRREAGVCMCVLGELVGREGMTMLIT